MSAHFGKLEKPENEKKLKKVAIYGRVSTKDKGQDVENQFIALRDYIKAHSTEFELVAEYKDEASAFKAGKADKRAKFTEMLADARVRKFDVLLFWSLDRFSREGALETMTHLRQLTQDGVSWRSHTEPYLDSLGPFGEVIIALIAVVARQESVRRSERALAAYERLRRADQWERVGRRKKIFPRDRVAVLRAGGASIREIQRKLLAEGYRVSRGTIERVLKGASEQEAGEIGSLGFSL